MIRALLLALALSGCEGRVHVESEDMGDGTMRYGVYYSRTWESVPIAQADPTKEADWPRLAARTVDLELVDATERVIVRVPIDPGTDWYLVDARHGFNVYQYAESPLRPDSLTVTNATPRTLLLEQAHVVTLAKPGDSLTVALEGSVTIREEASYDATSH